MIPNKEMTLAKQGMIIARMAIEKKRWLRVSLGRIHIYIYIHYLWWPLKRALSSNTLIYESLVEAHIALCHAHKYLWKSRALRKMEVASRAILAVQG